MRYEGGVGYFRVKRTGIRARAILTIDTYGHIDLAEMSVLGN